MSGKSTGDIFRTAFGHLESPCHILVILTIFQTFSLLLYLNSCKSHDTTGRDEDLLLADEQRKRFLEMESTPGEEAGQTVEMTTEDCKYDINLVDKVAAMGFGGLTPV